MNFYNFCVREKLRLHSFRERPQAVFFPLELIRQSNHKFCIYVLYIVQISTCSNNTLYVEKKSPYSATMDMSRSAARLS